MQTDKTYSVLLEQLSRGAREAVFDYDCADTIVKTFGRIMEEHPELFWLTGSCKYSKSVRGSEVKVTLIPEIMIDDALLKQRRQKFDQAVDAFTAGAEQSDDITALVVLVGGGTKA